MNEAQLWSKLSHPYIVKLYDYGTTPIPWIAMEYMSRGSLRTRLSKLTLTESLEIGRKLAEALFYAHHLGAIHRDMKPENILFDEQNTPKIADWGLGKVMLETGQSVSGFKGTIAYSAPEQFSNSKFGAVDWRTDIYQLGAMVYEMVTGQLPCGGDMVRILTEEPTRPSIRNLQVPAELDAIILKALAKNKDDRYEDISMLRQHLTVVLQNIKPGSQPAIHDQASSKSPFRTILGLFKRS